MSSNPTETIFYHDTRWGIHGRGIWLFPIGIAAAIAGFVLIWPVILRTECKALGVEFFVDAAVVVWLAGTIVVSFINLFQALHTARKIVALENDRFVISRFVGKPLIVRSLDVHEVHQMPNTFMTRHFPLHSQTSGNVKVVLSDTRYFYVAEECFCSGFSTRDLNSTENKNARKA